MAHTILIVEDETPIREALRDKLTQEGYAVTEARNGAEGLASALKDHPDLILLDLLMPVMPGMEALTALRKDTWGAHAKVLLLTNVNEREMLAQALELGVTSYVVKSDWKLENVVDLVKENI
jgi:CheY-like chemotaxis protein